MKFWTSTAFWASIGFVFALSIMTASYALADEYGRLEQRAFKSTLTELSVYIKHLAFTEWNEATFFGEHRNYFCVTPIDNGKVEAYVVSKNREGEVSTYPIDRESQRFSVFCANKEWFVRKKL